MRLYIKISNGADIVTASVTSSNLRFFEIKLWNQKLVCLCQGGRSKCPRRGLLSGTVTSLGRFKFSNARRPQKGLEVLKILTCMKISAANDCKQIVLSNRVFISVMRNSHCESFTSFN